MNYARLFTLLGLVVVVVAFAATWIGVPTARFSDDVPPLANFFMAGLGFDVCPGSQFSCAEEEEISRLLAGDLDDLRQRVLVVYASAAAVIALLGLAFGAARRRPETAPS